MTGIDDLLPLHLSRFGQVGQSAEFLKGLDRLCQVGSGLVHRMGLQCQASQGQFGFGDLHFRQMFLGAYLAQERLTATQTGLRLSPVSLTEMHLGQVTQRGGFAQRLADLLPDGTTLLKKAGRFRPLAALKVGLPQITSADALAANIADLSSHGQALVIGFASLNPIPQTVADIAQIIVRIRLTGDVAHLLIDPHTLAAKQRCLT